MFQEYALFPHRDVAGNVEFGLRMTRLGPRRARPRVDEVLELVGLDGSGRAGSRRSRAASSSGSRWPGAGGLAPTADVRRAARRARPGVAPPAAHRDPLDPRPLGAGRRCTSPTITTRRSRSRTASRSCATGGSCRWARRTAVWRQPADAWTATFLGFGPVVAAEVRDGLVRTPWGALGPRRGCGRGRGRRGRAARRRAARRRRARSTRRSSAPPSPAPASSSLAAAGAGPPLTVVVARRCRAGGRRSGAALDRSRRAARLPGRLARPAD